MRQIENKIVKVIEVKCVLKAALPLIIGSGDDEYTDMEIIKDDDRKPYIPGTAIAGVMRHYTDDPDDPKVFSEDRLSPIYTYDCEAIKYKISVRDGVELDENKVSKRTAKYDYEIIEAGAEFKLRFDLIIREKNQFDLTTREKNPKEKNSKIPHEKDIIECAKKFISSVENKEIYIGAKSKRGFGRVEIDGTIEVSDEEYFNKYDGEFKFIHEYDVLSVKLELQGGIMIRKYNDLPDEIDYVQLNSNGKPVIPGTTWDGAIRHRTEDIFTGLSKYDNGLILKFIERVFGSKMKEDQGQASLVIFEESTIDGGVDLPQTRVKIDRFTGGAVDSALYTEKPHYIGETTLVIKYPKDKHYIVGLLLPALEDLCRGYLAVGGETSIGRGIFKGDKILLNGKAFDKDFCYKELLREVESCQTK